MREGKLASLELVSVTANSIKSEIVIVFPPANFLFRFGLWLLLCLTFLAASSDQMSVSWLSFLIVTVGCGIQIEALQRRIGALEAQVRWLLPSPPEVPADPASIPLDAANGEPAVGSPHF